MGRWVSYKSDIPVEILAVEDIARLYAARWEIELIFKELKSHYRMDLIPSCKPRDREMLDFDRYSDVNVLTQDTPADSERMQILKMLTDTRIYDGQKSSPSKQTDC